MACFLLVPKPDLPLPELPQLPSSSSPRPPLRPPPDAATSACTVSAQTCMLAAGADDAALLVVVATAATTASTLDANHAAYVASAGTRRPSSSSSATHAELLLHRRHTPCDTRRHPRHRPTHGLTTSPHLRQHPHVAGHHQRASGDGNESHDEPTLLIPIVGTEDRRTITGTRDMATNAPAAERPIYWLVLFHSAHPSTQGLHDHL